MIIKSLNFKEKDSKGNEWNIDNFSFGKINLIVGQNSTGKSRVLNVVSALASFITGDRKISRGYFDVIFEDDGKQVKYTLYLSASKVEREKLVIDGKTLLEREEDGKGRITAVKLNLEMDFQVPISSVACAIKKDPIQHPFLENLHLWANSARHYNFGMQLGKDRLAIFQKVEKPSVPNAKDDAQVSVPNAKDDAQVVAFFRRAEKETSGKFSKQIKKDINAIGYEISKIGIGPIEGLDVLNITAEQPVGLYIKEKSHEHRVNQTEISQGLFRALSLFIQLRYSEEFCEPSLLLIDDIGEGLDYDRASKLINSVIDIATSSNTQLVMSTNDRFTMNIVPLKYWSILIRKGGNCSAMNYENSKDIFDEFDFTGMSNFDFFSSKYYQKNFKDA